jgi:transposase
MGEISTVGLDLAKSVFQVHGRMRRGGVVLRKKLRRDRLLAFFFQNFLSAWLRWKHARAVTIGRGRLVSWGMRYGCRCGRTEVRWHQPPDDARGRGFGS